MRNREARMSSVDVENQDKSLSPEEIRQAIEEKIDLHNVAEEYYTAEMAAVGRQNTTDREKSAAVDLATLTFKLREKLRNYDVIISDDAGARLPSLFFRQIINAEKNRDDLDRVETYFIAIGRHDMEEIYEGLRDFLKEKASGKKILLVSEYVDTGRSISKICKILDDLNVDYDLATVSSRRAPESDEYDCYPEIKKHMITGGVNYGGLHFKDSRGLGVKKNVQSDRPINQRIHPARNVRNQAFVNGTRKSIKMLAEMLMPLLER